VLGSSFSKVDVEVVGEIAHGQSGMPGQHGRDLGDGWVEARDVCVDLDAVAGREQQRLADRLGAVELVERLAQFISRDGGALED